MEKAQDFGRLRTVKVQQAVAKEEEEEMRVRMRQAQRKMKGVKLQYTDSDRVTFDDVAGVPGAKVELPILHPDTLDRRPPWGGRESILIYLMHDELCFWVCCTNPVRAVTGGLVC